MGIYNKKYNKWFLIDQKSDKESPPVWVTSMEKSSHRLALRKVEFDSKCNLYEFSKCSSDSTADSICRLIALHKVIEAKGVLTKSM